VGDLGIPVDIVLDVLEYASIPLWDSIAHPSLIVGSEDEFCIMIETGDAKDMSSVKKVTEIESKSL
jgi:acyl carrier protein